ncbi:hypothetical protein H8S37_14930 [Mediterraneibacter sp. NSJ-55]|uniref:DUF340 domain-containing protein n=1 Tax=Mediterraneibacter hominis TaxID=2763054 RepID=A0A923RR44_9FIRM|nr:hypothetical protein [Mediterraneibacter hominis]MBC5690210.1 hypothetical protein [Mediterraneibacter hominis]
MEAIKKKITAKQILNWLLCFIIIGIITIVCNFIGYDTGIVDAIPGIIILIALGTVGMILGAVFPKIPGTLWVVIIAMLSGAPIFPFSDAVIMYTNKIELSAIVPAILAYAGVAIGRDWKSFKRLGWRAVIIGCIAMLGTFFFSGLIAEIGLRLF